MCNSRESEHLYNTWLPTKHFYIFSVVFFFCENFIPRALPWSHLRIVAWDLLPHLSKKDGWESCPGFSPAPHIHASPKHWTERFSFHTAPKYLLAFPASLPDSLPPQPLEGERTGLAASQELCMCRMLPKVLTRAERTLSQEKGKVRGLSNWPRI